MANYKLLQSPLEILESMVNRLNEYFPNHTDKRKGVIHLLLSIDSVLIDCYIVSNGEQLILHHGSKIESNVTIRCTFFNWLKLSRNKLNPIWGSITRKLKFTGDTSFFKILPPINSSLDLAQKKDPLTDFERSPSKNWKVPQKVLVINASPRGERGYTTMLSEALIKGMDSIGAEVEEVYISKYKISNCTGCWNCWIKDTGSCVIKDEFSDIYIKEQQADLVVYALPLYVDGMPAQLKAYMDRHVHQAFPFMEDDAIRIRHPRRRKIQQSIAVLGVCGFPDISNFDALSHHFRSISINHHTPIVAELYRSSVMYLFNNPLLYAEQRDVLQAIEQAGKELVQYGCVSSKTKKRIEQVVVNTKDFVNLSNHFWQEKINSKSLDY